MEERLVLHKTCNNNNKNKTIYRCYTFIHKIVDVQHLHNQKIEFSLLPASPFP